MLVRKAVRVCVFVCVCVCMHALARCFTEFKASACVYEPGIKFGSSCVESVGSCLKTKQRKQRKRQITVRTAKQHVSREREQTHPPRQTRETDRDRQTETQRELFYCRMFTVPLRPQRSQGLLGTGTPGWPPLLLHSSA